MHPFYRVASPTATACMADAASPHSRHPFPLPVRVVPGAYPFVDPASRPRTK